MMMEVVRMMKRRIGEENVDQNETKLLLVKKILLQLGFLPVGPTVLGPNKVLAGVLYGGFNASGGL